MATLVYLKKMTWTMEEGLITKWLKREGDRVASDKTEGCGLPAPRWSEQGQEFPVRYLKAYVINGFDFAKQLLDFLKSDLCQTCSAARISV